MKILVYALTFLGYAYSGYGSGTLNNLRDAVLAAETVFQDVLGNVVTIARKFRDIHSVFDAAVDENCNFKCDTGMCPKESQAQIAFTERTSFAGNEDFKCN